MTTAVAQRLMHPRRAVVVGLIIATGAAAAVLASPALYVLLFIGAVALARAHPLAGWALPLLWLTVAGTEFRPEMIGVSGPQLRIFDVLAAGVVAGRVIRAPVRVGWRPFSGSLFLVAAVVVAGISTPGGSSEEAAETLHQVALVIIAALAAGEAVRAASVERLVLLVLLAGGIAALKTAAIWGSGVDVLNGPASLLQARSQVLPDLFVRRTILIGGSAVVAVATAIALAAALQKGRLRAPAGIVFFIGSLAVVMGMTRAYMAGVVTGGVVGVGFLFYRHRDRLALPRLSTVAMLFACVWIGGLAVSWNAERDPLTGMVERVVSPAARSASLQFRGDETSAILDELDGPRLIVGGGLGGQFQLRAAGLDPDGNGYAHSWVFWVLLKSGIIGLALTSTALALMLSRLLPWRRGAHDPALTLVGAALVVVLVASLGANVLPTAEGQWLLGTALAVAAAPGSRPLQADDSDETASARSRAVRRGLAHRLRRG